ncbi:hypothetical protein B0T25DRAFT_159511 [Lasiosphaeria hispida]|uniref:Uncharacterized protein n=1 Tax=Lasiosphaeria hispida TaxID=260671 RepID=A0AAJ0HM76_9PEZI|nr:hypothetical protein B0T25DRAFT_159511 [Lasiosphaeria hispida]
MLLSRSRWGLPRLSVWAGCRPLAGWLWLCNVQLLRAFAVWHLSSRASAYSEPVPGADRNLKRSGWGPRAKRATTFWQGAKRPSGRSCHFPGFCQRLIHCPTFEHERTPASPQPSPRWVGGGLSECPTWQPKVGFIHLCLCATTTHSMRGMHVAVVTL